MADVEVTPLPIPLRPRVLISDDEATLVSALAREARHAGLTPITDTSGSNLVALAKEHQPEVIVLDVNHHIDGRDLLSKLKKDPETRDIKVVMFSGVYDQFVRHTCLELGAVDYELKPLDARFMTKVARWAYARDED